MERVVPNLPADDLRVAKDFYVGRLGFSVTDPFGNLLYVVGPVK